MLMKRVKGALRATCIGAVLALASPAAAQEAPIAITGVTLIDGTGRAPRANVTVVIDKGRIARTGGAVPKDATRIDGTGRFLLPGFIDSNVHATVYGNPARRDTSSRSASSSGPDRCASCSARGGRPDGTR